MANLEQGGFVLRHTSLHPWLYDAHLHYVKHLPLIHSGLWETTVYIAVMRKHSLPHQHADDAMCCEMRGLYDAEHFALTQDTPELHAQQGLSNVTIPGNNLETF